VNPADEEHQNKSDNLARECSPCSPRGNRLRAIHDMLECDQYDPPALLIAEKMIDRALAIKEPPQK
jgi:hypothetical protein